MVTESDYEHKPSIRLFDYRSTVATTMAEMIAFHDNPRALRRLTPPPIIMQQIRDERNSLTEGELEFRLWFGPFPVRWLARHEPGPTETSFADRMLRGPMAYWRHQHVFREVAGGIELHDHIEYAHQSGPISVFMRLLFNGLSLRFLFFYRHWQTRRLIGGKPAASD